jgi:hypothetical protein
MLLVLARETPVPAGLLGKRLGKPRMPAVEMDRPVVRTLTRDEAEELALLWRDRAPEDRAQTPDEGLAEVMLRVWEECDLQWGMCFRSLGE